MDNQKPQIEKSNNTMDKRKRTNRQTIVVITRDEQP